MFLSVLCPRHLNQHPHDSPYDDEVVHEMSLPQWKRDNKTFMLFGSAIPMPPTTRKRPLVLLFDIGGVCVRTNLPTPDTPR